MYLNVSGGKGRLVVSAAVVKPLREAFIKHVCRAAELAGVEAPLRETFSRNTTNPTFRSWRGIERNAECGAVAACVEWLDPVLGYEKFVAHMGPRPDEHENQRQDRTRPWGPGNAAWAPATPYTVVNTSAGEKEIRRARAAYLSAKHGLDPRDLERRKDSHLYQIWRDMVTRCNNRFSKDYKNYGGRGIMLHDEWDDSCDCGYEEFATYVLSALGPCPEGYSIDRIDVNQDYEPGNIRWATDTEQANNKQCHNPPPPGWIGGRRFTREMALTDATSAELDAVEVTAAE